MCFSVRMTCTVEQVNTELEIVFVCKVCFINELIYLKFVP